MHASQTSHVVEVEDSVGWSIPLFKKQTQGYVLASGRLLSSSSQGGTSPKQSRGVCAVCNVKMSLSGSLNFSEKCMGATKIWESGYWRFSCRRVRAWFALLVVIKTCSQWVWNSITDALCPFYSS